MNKKAQLFNPVMWLIIAFIVVIILALLIFFFGQITNVMQTIPSPSPSVNMTEIIDTTFVQVNRALGFYKTLAFLMLFAFAISIFIVNFLERGNPWFFFLHVGISIVALIISVPLSNAYEGLLSNDVLGPTLLEMTAATWIMLWLPTWVVIIAFVGAIFLLSGIARREQSQQGGVDIIG